MTSIIKVNNIQSSASNAAATIASNGAVTFPQAVTFSGTVTGDNAGSVEKISTGAAATGTSHFDISLPTTAGKYSRFLWNIRGVRMSVAHGFGLRFQTQGGSVRGGADRTNGDYFAYNFEELQGSAATGEDNPASNAIRATYYNLAVTDDPVKYWTNYEFVICGNEASNMCTIAQYTGYGGNDYNGTNYYCWRRGFGGVQTAEVNDLMRIQMLDYAQTTFTATMTHEGWELYGVLK
jgi:hypothetical protein